MLVFYIVVFTSFIYVLAYHRFAPDCLHRQFLFVELCKKSNLAKA